MDGPDFGDLDSALGAPAPTPTPTHSDPGAPDFSELDDALSAATRPAAKAPARHVPRQTRPAPVPATQFHKATAQAPDEPELSWGQTAQQALHNAPASALGVGKSMLDAVTHPVQTLSTLGQVGKGLYSQAQGALGVQQDPQQKAQAEAVAKALENHYATTYGSVKGFKKAAATDPVSIAMDASTLLGGTGAAADAAGLVKTAGVLGKAASVVDPVQNALRVARVPGKVASAAARGIGSVTSGVPESVLKIATTVGASSDPIMKSAFNRFASGQGDTTEFANEAHAAMAKVRQDASDAYLNAKAPLLTKPVSLSNTQAALAKAQADLGKGSPLGFVPAKQRLGELQQLVDSVANNPNPAMRNVDNIDTLKQQVYDLHGPNQADKAGAITNNVYHGIKADLAATDPAYAKLMETYSAGLRNISDLTKTLGLKPTSAASATLAKSLKATKTATGQNLLNQLTTQNPKLAGMIAGAAINPWSQHNSIWEALAGAGLPAIIAHPVGMAGALPGAAAGFALSSPRLVGTAAKGAGTISRGLNTMAGPAGQAAERGAYYSGRADQEQGISTVQPIDPTQNPIFQRMLQIESGNQQFDKSGNPKTSPKGAIGAAQIMPKTGPQAAALAGEPWDPERFASDQAYNTRLGQAYHDHLTQQFGNPILGAAAYNAGPGRVQKALQMAEQTGKSWLKFLPKETQQYVAALSEGSAFGGRIERASGGSVPDRVDDLTSGLMDRAEKARKSTTQDTKPLLQAPDELVAQALKTAQQSAA